MGYQESFVKFDNNEVAVEEIEKYMDRDTSDHTTTLYNVVRVAEDIPMFSKDELVLIVGGERYDQRGPFRLEEGLGIKNSVDVIYIDDYLFDYRGEMEGKAFLDTYFKDVHPNELGMEV